jgi:hypothetical protein
MDVERKWKRRKGEQKGKESFKPALRECEEVKANFQAEHNAINCQRTDWDTHLQTEETCFDFRQWQLFF